MPTTSSSIEDLLGEKGLSKLKKTTSGISAKKKKKKNKLADEKTTTEALSDKIDTINVNKKEQETAELASQHKLPYINLEKFPISGEALKTVDFSTCQKEKVICFVNTGEQIRLGIIDPKNPEAPQISHALAERLHAKVELYLISQRSFDKALALYDKQPRYSKPIVGVEINADDLEKFKNSALDFTKLNEVIKKTNITELVNLLIASAIQTNSSDIHVEAEESEIKVRFRIDGVLHDTASIKKEDWTKIIARIKLLSGLKLNVIEKPQDGRFTIHLKEETIDVRVSCLPTTWGESVVMRLLKSSTASLTFEDLGLTGKAFENLKHQVERPNGMIIATGPTGSGKTTTLYAVLNKLNQEDVKIITLEDPVEYKLKGINQSQVDHNKGYSFADGLRSLLRQDPDVVMVGEMRDLETAEVAINAALTGHLVISTIHTNNAAGAIPRFLAMQVRPFLLAPALNAIIGQRLVRKICEKCKKEITPEQEMMKKIEEITNSIPDGHPDKPDLKNAKFFQGQGCEQCHGLGYKGRVGIYEIMTMTPEIEKSIMSGNISEDDLQNIAIKNGMITMVQDGIIKVLKGITTPEEVFRVIE